jgi:hypothetical protein
MEKHFSLIVNFMTCKPSGYDRDFAWQKFRDELNEQAHKKKFITGN